MVKYKVNGSRIKLHISERPISSLSTHSKDRVTESQNVTSTIRLSCAMMVTLDTMSGCSDYRISIAAAAQPCRRP
jgi:hypothetical protein